MKSNSSTRNITIAAVLVAMGILIPMIMPKIPVPPASYTLGSHVPIFLSMFFSPLLAGVVALGTAFGFFLSGMPFIISVRALSHVIFAVLGAVYLKNIHKLFLIINC